MSGLILLLAALLTRSLQPPAPPVAYTQQLLEQGILIKAPASVDREALSAAAVIVRQMLGGVRPDIRARLVASKAAIAITPKDRSLCVHYCISMESRSEAP
jgi:hypothetical protein